MNERVIEPDGSHDFEPCDCCGDNSRTVWGLVHRDNITEAAYFVHWSLGKVTEKGAFIDLILGPWGEGTDRADRYAVSLEFRQGFGVRVIDASLRNIARHSLVGRGLVREDVIMTPLAQEVFEIIDTIWAQDSRFAPDTPHSGRHDHRGLRGRRESRLYLRSRRISLCVQCYPCQLGTVRQYEILHRVASGHARDGDRERLEDVGGTMIDASLCGLGQTAATAVLSAMKVWPEMFETRR